jgi:hypothetical protein
VEPEPVVATEPEAGSDQAEVVGAENLEVLSDDREGSLSIEMIERDGSLEIEREPIIL